LPTFRCEDNNPPWRLLDGLNDGSETLRLPPPMPPVLLVSQSPFRGHLRTTTHSMPPLVGVPNALVARDEGGWGSKPVRPISSAAVRWSLRHCGEARVTVVICV
jgi:hypothetical protein